MAMENTDPKIEKTKDELTSDLENAIAKNDVEGIKIADEALKKLEAKFNEIKTIPTSQLSQIENLKGDPAKINELTKNIDTEAEQIKKEAEKKIEIEKLKDILEDLEYWIKVDTFDEAGNTSMGLSNQEVKNQRLAALQGKKVGNTELNFSNGTVLHASKETIQEAIKKVQLELVKLQDIPSDSIPELEISLKNTLEEIEKSKNELDAYRNDKNHNVAKGNEMSNKLSLLWAKRDVINAKLDKLKSS